MSTKSKSKKPAVEIPADEFSPENVRFRVTMFIQEDVLNEVRKRAAQKGLPYQTYINLLLREQMFGSELEQKVRKIVQDEIKKQTA
jgi:predicted DNA binding CopG/RHH family protein